MSNLRLTFLKACFLFGFISIRVVKQMEPCESSLVLIEKARFPKKRSQLFVKGLPSEFASLGSATYCSCDLFCFTHHHHLKSQNTVASSISTLLLLSFRVV